MTDPPCRQRRRTPGLGHVPLRLRPRRPPGRRLQGRDRPDRAARADHRRLPPGQAAGRRPSAAPCSPRRCRTCRSACTSPWSTRSTPTHARGVAVRCAGRLRLRRPGQRAGLRGLGGRRRRRRGVRAGQPRAVGDQPGPQLPRPRRVRAGRRAPRPRRPAGRGRPAGSTPARWCRRGPAIPYVHGDHVHGEIRMVDHFGNLALNVRRSDLEAAGIQLGDVVELRCGGRALGGAVHAQPSARCRRGRTVVCEDSFRAITIAVNGGRADRMLRAGSGDPVVLGRVHRLLGRPRPRSPSWTARRASCGPERLESCVRGRFRSRTGGGADCATGRGPRHRRQPPARRPARRRCSPPTPRSSG